MLNQPRPGEPTKRNLRRERKLWHDEKTQPSVPLGCSNCMERGQCGALRIRSKIFDCLSFCCGKPGSCDKVCRNNPSFPDRVREIGGFDLSNTPRASLLEALKLPTTIPLIYHGNSRNTGIASEAVALSLYSMFNRRDGSPRFTSHEQLAEKFGFAPGTKVVLTGTDKDPPLERWWGLGGDRRRKIIRGLHDLKVSLATTPNYSLLLDLPRWDDLHSMKRIALVHHEFLDEGILAALHVNGRTETDFKHWTEYLVARPEITHLAYEFTTGTGWAGRREQHAEWLTNLATMVGRPLHITIRGGTEILPILSRAFSDLCLIETSVFMKTMMRRRAIAGNAGITWRSTPTATGAPLDALFQENFQIVDRWTSNAIVLRKVPTKTVGA